MGLGAEQAAGSAEDLLGRSERTEVLAEGFAAVGPAADQGGQQGGSKQQGQDQSVAVGDQQPQAQAGDQQTPLQLDVVACEPGRLRDGRHLGFAGAVQHRALPAQGPEQLGDK